MKNFIIGLCLVLVLPLKGLMAKDYAYIYIEGDKQTPFYVKLEGQMMPRLGKNYFIIPNLDAGISNIEILFQQNLYPPQKFTVKIPEGGYRGFVLKKVSVNQFALYDMQQGFYLVTGNSINDDKILPQHAQPTPAVTGTVAAAGSTAVVAGDLPAFTPAPKTTKTTTKPKPEVKSEPAAAGNTDPRFLDGIELNTAAGATTAGTVAATKTIKKGRTILPDYDTTLAAAPADEFGQKETAMPPQSNSTEPLVAVGIANSDCKAAMTNEEFEGFATKILDETTDDDKLKVLNKERNRHCFTTEQVRIIANNLETQSGRYEVTRILFARTSDQDNYPKLEALFKTNYLKDKFREIMNPK